MRLLYFKTLLKNISLIRVRNWFINELISGRRSAKSFIIAWGNFKFSVKEKAAINIDRGILNLNKAFSKPDTSTGILKMSKNAKINVRNGFDIYSGHHIVIMKNAVLNLGSGYINYNLKIRCHQEISIGENVAFSENLTIWDSDSHEIIGSENLKTQPIRIGNNVWIGINVTILKGVTIGDGSVISAGSVVTKNIPANCLAGGVPAKVLRTDIQWK